MGPTATVLQNHPILHINKPTMSQYTHTINGKSATSPTTLDVQNPATQKKIAEVPVATKEQVRL
jgi:hypothetical protein